MLVRYQHGTTAALHALAMPTAGDQPELWVMRPSAPSLAMGSSQKPDLFAAELLAAQGIELAPRRSGGGAVFIDPAHTVWIDVLAPRTSPWWSAELAETFQNVGRIWQRALGSLGVKSDVVVEAPVRTPASTLACWAGVGWGEVVVAGAKVVGLSQRRTRWGARIQAMAVLDASAARVADFLHPEASHGLEQQVVRQAIPVDHAPVLRTAAITPPVLEQAVLHAFNM